MEYQQIRTEIFKHLVSLGYSVLGRNAAYKITEGSYILIKPRKHTNASAIFSVDYGIFYQFPDKGKKPIDTMHCHLSGEFTNVINWRMGEFSKNHEVWATDTADIEKILGLIDSEVIPYLEKISTLSYIQENYPLKHLHKQGTATSLTNHNYLLGLDNTN